MTTPQELFGAGRLLARRKCTYMRAMLLSLVPNSTPGLGTLGVTEAGVLMLDWDFVKGLLEEEPHGEKAALMMAGSLIHECMHLLLLHGKRARLRVLNRERANRAADLTINPAVIDMGLLLPKGVLFPENMRMQDGTPFKRGLTMDEYYKLLEENPQPGDGQGGEGGGVGVSDPNGKPGLGKGRCGSCAGNAMPHEPDGESSGGRSKGEMERNARAVAQAIREAQQSSQGRGTVPGFLSRWADDVLTPPEIPWEKELAQVTRQAVAWRDNAVDHRYDAPSRRQAGIGYGPGKPMLPRFRMPVPNVAVIIDTSGSMGMGSGSALHEAASEVAGILKALGANVTFCTCDADVQGVKKVSSMREALQLMKGGGGTDMAPAFAAVMQMKPRPEVVVCLTDLQIGDPGPQPRGVKTIWVGVGPYQGPPPAWGRTISIKKNKQPQEEES